jgi:hypothetical protein
MTPSTEKEYQRLPGKGSTFAGRCRLFLGRDHLMAVHTRFTVEEYRRFPYGDIQALICRRTHTGKVSNLFYALFLALFLFMGYRAHFFHFIYLALAAPFLAGLVYNLWRGPTCAVRVKTAVQTDALPSLHHLRTFRKAREKIEARILAVQGAVDPAVLTAAVEADSLAEETPARPTERGQARRRGGAVSLHFHWLLFAVLAVHAAAVGWQVFVPRPILVAAAALTVMAALGLAAAALTRQYGGDLPVLVRRLTWAALGYALLGMGLGSAAVLVTAVVYPEESGHYWQVFQRLSAYNAAWFQVVMATAGVLSGLIGVFGLLSLRRPGKA